MSNDERSSSATSCRNCGEPLIPGANFCHHCGTSAGAPPAAPTARRRQDVQGWNWKTILFFIVVVTAWSALLLFVALKFLPGKNASVANPHAGLAVPAESVPPPVDLSTMTPRQAADRLFNRVMAADERGDRAEVMQFGPMALEAYKLVDLLDADARYHIGLISLLLGDLDNVRRQINNLESEAPDHLLGLALSIKAAEKVGDGKAASIARARFAGAYDVEIGKGRPEYEAHRVTLESLRAATMR